ncbi:hypothetical protein ASE06_11570 [Sphingopyxis sp. Root214]|uniref:hypothetical protein n=1 Tax=unclassified Sphingopyxis TaxID=2614943 RepID=UPI0006FE092B|nr:MULTISPECIES: hypothetical protein [unclassified Sphingopyxis]KQZ73067.1 hypothetical protein ASD73_09220 [Sphingopyxis sp. Root154]KRC07214.1 hypothetical protein ASE06_11570 [Sphingopyxis sp. Root214]
MGETSVRADILARPFAVAADTALLGNLVRDASSGDRTRRAEAVRVEKAMEAAGAVFLLSLHHLEELLSHGNDAVVIRRVAWLQARPVLASIACHVGPGPGSICDLLVTELCAIADDPSAPAAEARDRVVRDAIIFRSGADLLAGYEQFWPILREQFTARAQRSSAIAAVVQGTLPNVGKRKLKEFLGGSLRRSGDMLGEFEKMKAALGSDIALRHDGNVADPEALAAEFMHHVVAEASHLDPASRNVVRDDLLRRGLDPSDLDPERPMADIIDLLEFRSRVETIAEYLPPDLSEFRHCATLDRLPSWRIERGLRRFRQSRPKNPGSDIGDRHLGCLGAYADLTFVDRRTHEDFMRARRGDPDFAGLLRRVEKSRTWPSFLGAIARMGSQA